MLNSHFLSFREIFLLNILDTDLVFFEFSFDLNPVHVSADYSVFLKMEPVKIVHDTVW